MKIILISTSTFPADQGLRTLSACLKREGHNVKILFLPLDENYSNIYPENILKQVKTESCSAGLIGISAMESTTKRAIQLISMYKSMNVPAVWGGAHPTFFPDKCFQFCDIVCVGEAEDAIIELAKKLENNGEITNIKNLYVRVDGNEYRNPVRPAIVYLDT